VNRRGLTGAVDFGHLEHFAAGDGALIDEVLALFRAQSAAWMQRLEPDGEAGAFRDAAHTLKGAALGVGAFALAEACDAAETGADLDAEHRAIAAGRMRETLEAALADMAAYVEAARSLKGEA
jgi:HPt (histidine-containing phosphotransfer) domain-containing protein